MNESIEARNRQERFGLIFDAARKCLAIIDKKFGKIKEYAAIISEKVDGKLNFEIESLELFDTTIGLIDFCHRYCELVKALPLISNRDVNMKKIYDQSERIEPIRNYLQHVRSELSTKDDITFPILGSISWLHNNEVCSITTKQLSRKCTWPSISYNTGLRKYVHEYQFAVKDHILGLEDAHRLLLDNFNWLSSLVTFDPPQPPGPIWRDTQVMKSKMLTQAEADNIPATEAEHLPFLPPSLPSPPTESPDSTT